MLPFISFILMWLGCLNWFFISAFQYDFVAGFFGTQSSLFSRIIYFAIGMAAFYFLFFVIKNKGKITLFKNPFKNRKTKESVPIAVPVETIETNEEEKQVEIEKPIYTSPSSVTTTVLTTSEPKAESGYKDFDVTKYDN
ncbi:MAG: DUF378 domain-containing protein [Clostridia bacterium]|nr:DUF378 domain-containing protein [Clostridia bacterium]